jgi:hypothetical protein
MPNSPIATHANRVKYSSFRRSCSSAAATAAGSFGHEPHRETADAGTAIDKAAVTVRAKRFIRASSELGRITGR